MRTTIGTRFAIALLFFAWSTGSALAQARADAMTVRIEPGVLTEAGGGNGDVHVTLTVPGMQVAAGEPVARLPVMLPGASKPQQVADVTVTDASGAAPVTVDDDGGTLAWRCARPLAGEVTIRYRLPLENAPPLAGGPPIGLRIDGDGFSGAADRLIMAPAGDAPRRIEIVWDLVAMGPGASAVTSYGDGDVVLPQGPVAVLLNRTLLMAGHVEREDKGAFSAVWTGDPGFDPRPAMRWTAELHQAMSRFFRDETEPPYRVFLRHNPMNAGGGAAMTHSFLVTYGTGVSGESIKGILGHEMTHTWTATGIGKWYDEGNAVYYQALLSWRAGMITTDEYLEDLNRTASRYYTNPMRGEPDAEVMPRFWLDTRYRVLPYDRGAMYFAVLNGKIVKASHGQRSVDDLVLAMVERSRQGQPVTEAAWLDLLRQELGDDGVEVHRSMLAGGLMLPDSDGFGPAFRRVTAKIRQFDVGFDMRSLVGSAKRVTGLQPGSEAAKAGLQDGDAIRYATGLDSLQRLVTSTFTLQVTRDGETFPITYLPRGEAVEAYQWQRVPVEPPRPSNEPEDFLREPPRPSSLRGSFTLTAVGELLYSHPLALTSDVEMQKVFALVRQGDATFGHLEVPIFDFDGFVGQGYGDGLLWGEAALAADIRALGVDMVSLASNHGTDWGGEGLLETSRLLDAQHVVHAGGGRSLHEARQAGVLATPKGRVALVSTASTFKPNAGANDPMGEVPARTGISILRTRRITLVTADEMAKVRELATSLASPRKPAPAPDAREVTLGDDLYRLADAHGLTYEMDLYDHAGLLAAVREAKQVADLVIFTIHAHESPTGMDDDAPAPPDFLVRLCHDVVDAGADVVIGHGQHSLRAIEIYKGRPVFYGMGAFFIRGNIKVLPETVFRAFPDATGHAPPPAPKERSVRPGGNPASWYDGVVAQIDFEDGEATVVRLHALDTGNTYEEARRGVPHLADPTNARRILTRLREWSMPFGVDLAIEDGVGVIRIQRAR
ncbi:MAG TPA: CapA family protein [Planctomycetota bacterium]|nr:CapA family protein [Planctomycetota bacterium]